MWKLPEFVTEEDLTDKPLILFLILASVLQTSITYSRASQPRLANKDVVALVDHGLPESLVLRAIDATEQDFDLGPHSLRDLKEAGVSSDVIDAMLRKSASVIDFD
jgi:hypothetical protein